MNRPKRNTGKASGFLGRLDREMDRWNLNQATVAARLKVSPGTVSGWFSKGALPQPRILADLARIFDVNPEWLLYGTEPKLSPAAAQRGEQAVKSQGGALRTTEHSPHWPVLQVREVPLISWAQAGQATSYEEIPSDWQEKILVPTTHERAIAIRLRGDSMEPRYQDGDTVVVLPSVSARNGDLVVANIKEEGFAFKVLTLVGGNPELLKLTSYNPVYPPMELSRERFHWIYPVHSVTKIVRR